MFKKTVPLATRLLSPINGCIQNNCLRLDVPLWRHIQVASVVNLKPPKNYDHVVLPEGRRRLRMLEKIPSYIVNQTVRPAKSQKRLIDMRGPELIHNKLIYKQYGIKALGGGQLHWGHIEMIRRGINRKFDENRMFAVWRIESPWKPLTHKGLGKRMGGGKGSIKEYVTPVRENRMILEVAGKFDFEEIEPKLRSIAHKLPFKAKVVTQEIMEEDERMEQYMRDNNINPFNFKYCLKNNMLGCKAWASPYDYFWYGKYR